jgi:hypothetical protein
MSILLWERSMAKDFEREGKWERVRNDEHFIVYEKHAIPTAKEAEKLGFYSEKPQIVMHVLFNKHDGKKEEWLGYYQKDGSQRGMSFHPTKDYPELKKYYIQGLRKLPLNLRSVDEGLSKKLVKV